jgi:hypothetical protein
MSNTTDTLTTALQAFAADHADLSDVELDNTVIDRNGQVAWNDPTSEFALICLDDDGHLTGWCSIDGDEFTVSIDPATGKVVHTHTSCGN